uniref:Uncharacterized protein n=1 Tax=Cyanoptyche gloeocystis TaxID=77922 RepID=A0A3G1IWD3_9EUKA|nr:hypothetical protein [Cyanoptyche gloeocystis]
MFSIKKKYKKMTFLELCWIILCIFLCIIILAQKPILPEDIPLEIVGIPKKKRFKTFNEKLNSIIWFLIFFVLVFSIFLVIIL